ncbi:MAG TPA: hypothetical protein VH743_09930 [Beijerinckiaceae bacterium]
MILTLGQREALIPVLQSTTPRVANEFDAAQRVANTLQSLRVRNSGLHSAHRPHQGAAATLDQPFVCPTTANVTARVRSLPER